MHKPRTWGQTNVRQLIVRALARPKWVVAGSAALAAAMLVPVLRLRPDDSLRVWLVRGRPAAKAYDRFVQTFGGDDVILISFDRPEGERTLRLVLASRLAAALRGVPGVRNVTDTGQLVALLGPRYPALVGQLITADGRTLALACTLDSTGGPSQLGTLRAVRAAIARAGGPDFTYHLAGPAILNEALEEIAREGVTRILPWVVVLCTLVLLLAVRQALPVVLSLGAVAATIMAPLGVLALAGGTMNLLLAVTPSLLFVVCLSYCLHLITTYRRRLAGGASAREAAVWAAEAVAWRCLMCSLTTAAGFGSLALSRLAPVRSFGLLTALGVMVGFVMCCVVLPAGLILWGRVRASAALRHGRLARPWGKKKAAPADAPSVAWGALSGWARRWRRVILVVALMLTVGGGAAGLRLRAAGDPLGYLPRTHPLVRDWVAIESRFGSPSPITVEVAIEPGRKLPPVAVLPILEAIEEYLKFYPSVKATQSLVDWLPLWDLRQPFDELLPALRDVAPRLRTADGSRFAVYARYDIAERDIHARLQRDLEAFVGEAFGQGVTVTVTGVLALINDSERELMRVMLWSLLVATVVILGMLLAVVGSLRAMLVATLPTILPVVVTLGVMGLAGVPADPGTVTVAAVALGLAVDHTIHILCAYRGHRSAGRANPVAASLDDCGRAVLLTSLASAVGFGVLAISPFRPVMHFGLFLGLAMVLSLGAAVIVLPAMMHLAARREQKA